MAAAAAHPMGARYEGHRVDVSIEADRVLVDYTFEMPTRNLLDEIAADEKRGLPADGWPARKRSELVSGLTIAIDGETALSEAAPVEARTADPGFTSFAFRFERPLPDGDVHTLAIGNANQPGELAYFANAAYVDDDWDVTATSLVTLDADGRIDRNLQGRWRMEEEHRQVTVTVARRTGPAGWLARTFAAEDRLVPVDEAMTTSTWDRISRGWLPLAVGALALAAAGVAVLLRRQPRRPASETSLLP